MTTAVQAKRSAVSKVCLARLIWAPMPSRGRHRTSGGHAGFPGQPHGGGGGGAQVGPQGGEVHQADRFPAGEAVGPASSSSCPSVARIPWVRFSHTTGSTISPAITAGTWSRPVHSSTSRMKETTGVAGRSE